MDRKANNLHQSGDGLRFKWIILFVFLALFLFGPFLLRHLNGQLEVYPAVLLPAGASLSYRQDTLLAYQNILLYGLDSVSRQRKKLDSKDFIAPIPHRYLRGIVGNRFGLDSFSEITIYLPKLGLRVSKQRRRTAPDIDETKSWLRNRLRYQACHDSFLFIVQRKEWYNLNINAVDSSKILSEEVYQLY